MHTVVSEGNVCRIKSAIGRIWPGNSKNIGGH